MPVSKELLLLPLLSIDIDVAGATSIGSRNKAEQTRANSYCFTHTYTEIEICLIAKCVIIGPAWHQSSQTLQSGRSLCGAADDQKSLCCFCVCVCVSASQLKYIPDILN